MKNKIKKIGKSHLNECLKDEEGSFKIDVPGATVLQINGERFLIYRDGKIAFKSEGKIQYANDQS